MNSGGSRRGGQPLFFCARGFGFLAGGIEPHASTLETQRTRKESSIARAYSQAVGFFLEISELRWIYFSLPILIAR
jgi:hypothetical protein